MSADIEMAKKWVKDTAGELLDRMPPVVRRPIKKGLDAAADNVADWVKSGEEYLDPAAVTLDGMKRSLQFDDYSCGAQSCYMILRYYGKARSKENVQKALGTTEEDGTDAGPMLALFRKRGLRVKVIARGTIKDICRAIDSAVPMLAYSETAEHWFVIYGYSDSCIYVLDPSLRQRLMCAMPKRDFRKYWSGWCAVVDKNGKVSGRKAKIK